jgi:hypothetical protein
VDNAPIIKVLRMVAKEFDSIADGEVQSWIGLCAPLVNKKRFGKLYDQALAYLTAHRMKMAGVGIAKGGDPLEDIGNIGVGNLLRVGNYSEGETSIGFNNNISQYAENDAELALTSYGIQYLTLRRTRILPIVSAGESLGGL